MSENEHPRVMLCVDSATTSGHISAASRLARALADRGCAVTLISGEAEFAMMKGFDYGAVQCAVAPSLIPRVTPENPWGSVTPSGLDYKDDKAFQQQRRDFLLQTYAQTKPDIFISEFWPAGHCRFDVEMLPLMERMAQDRANNPKQRPLRVAYLRDLMTEPEFHGNGKDGTAKRIDQHFDAAVIAGDGRLTPWEETLGEHAALLKDKLHYAGYPFDPASVPAYEGEPEVVVSFGGGYQASSQRLWHAVAQARLDATPSVALAPWHFFISKACPDADIDEIRVRVDKVREQLRVKYPGADVPPVILERANPSFPEYLKTAKLAILRGGTTAAESAVLGRPSVLIPFMHHAGNENNGQYKRCSLLARKLDSVVKVDQEQLDDPRVLAQAMDEAYRGRFTASRTTVQGNGSKHAASTILDLYRGISRDPSKTMAF